MSSWVLDASAVLALLMKEPGSESVAHAIAAGAMMSTVNLSEVIAKLSDGGMPEAAIRTAIGSLGLQFVDFNTQLAYWAGLLRTSTRSVGLSLGDRTCLALAQEAGLPAITADRAWRNLSLGVAITVIR